MQRFHRNLLTTACFALAAAAAFAPPAQAQSNCSGQTNGNCGSGPYTFGALDAFGAGSSLVAPYWRQTLDCYDQTNHSAALIVNTTPNPTAIDENFYTSSLGTCPLGVNKQTSTTWYISTGSGGGIKGVFSHNPAVYGHVDFNNTQYFPEVFYGLSDAGLGSTDVGVYNSGGTEQGLNFDTFGSEACSSTSTNPYPNPLQCYGPLVQFPFSVDPVTMFYGGSDTTEQTGGIQAGIYEKWDDSSGNETVYKLNVQNQRSDGSGGLRLSPASYCGIWNGQITNWNDPSLTADNGGVSLEDPNDPAPAANWSVPLIPVGRSDSSGTTSIITRHLANVCSGFPHNQYTTGATTISGAGAGNLVGNTYSTSSPNYPGVDQAGKITLAPNSGGVAQYVAFTATPGGFGGQCADYGSTELPPGAQDCIQQTRIGYVGPDYVLPSVLNTGTNAYGLQTASLKNSSGNWEAPTAANAATAFGSIQPPQSSKSGQYCASCTSFGMRANPYDWVEGLSPTVPLANPGASSAYPVVGTTNFLGYTCYKSSKPLKYSLLVPLDFTVFDAINYDTGKGILAKAGLSPLPKQWRTAIHSTFLTNQDGLGLNMAVVGTAGACSVSGVVGG